MDEKFDDDNLMYLKKEFNKNYKSIMPIIFIIFILLLIIINLYFNFFQSGMGYLENILVSNLVFISLYLSFILSDYFLFKSILNKKFRLIFYFIFPIIFTLISLSIFIGFGLVFLSIFDNIGAGWFLIGIGAMIIFSIPFLFLFYFLRVLILRIFLKNNKSLYPKYLIFFLLNISKYFQLC